MIENEIDIFISFDEDDTRVNVNCYGHFVYPFKVESVYVWPAIVYLLGFKRCCLLVQLQVRLFTCSASRLVVSYAPIVPSASPFVNPYRDEFQNYWKVFLLAPWVSFGIRNTDHHDRNDDDGEHGDCDDVVGHVFPFVACDDLIIL